MLHLRITLSFQRLLLCFDVIFFMLYLPYKKMYLTVDTHYLCMLIDFIFFIDN